MAKAQAAAETENADTSSERQGILDADGEGFTFDMESQEADAGFPMHPAGVYDFAVDTCNYKISSNSGHPMWELRFLITGPGDEVAEKKVQVRYYQSFKPEQMPRAKQFLERVAPELATRDFNPKRIADDGILIGRTGRCRLGIRRSEEYGDSNEVKAILPPGSNAGGAGGGGFRM